jgi:hypothetical protein
MHRSTRSRVSKNAHLDNFNPADALESLHIEIAQLEVFAHPAGEVITRLSPPASPAERHEFQRLYALVTKVAEDSLATVNHSDELIAALSAHLAAQSRRAFERARRSTSRNHASRWHRGDQPGLSTWQSQAPTWAPKRAASSRSLR